MTLPANDTNTASTRLLPLGNLTSQLLVNVYLNEFDQFIKHRLKARHYVRYADDFVLLANNPKQLAEHLPKLERFLTEVLKLSMHPDKVAISRLSSGIDFLGWVHFRDHRVLRTTTKRRMLKNLSRDAKSESVQSYLGLLQHGNARKLSYLVCSHYAEGSDV